MSYTIKTGWNIDINCIACFCEKAKKCTSVSRVIVIIKQYIKIALIKMIILGKCSSDIVLSRKIVRMKSTGKRTDVYRKSRAAIGWKKTNGRASLVCNMLNLYTNSFCRQ